MKNYILKTRQQMDSEFEYHMEMPENECELFSYWLTREGEIIIDDGSHCEKNIIVSEIQSDEQEYHI